MRGALEGLWRKAEMSKTGLRLNRSLELQLLTFTEQVSGAPTQEERGGAGGGREGSLGESQQAAAWWGSGGFFVLVWLLFLLRSKLTL